VSVSNLGLEDVNIYGSGDYIGAWWGIPSTSECNKLPYDRAVIGDGKYVGGLVGYQYWVLVANCYATGAVAGMKMWVVWWGTATPGL